MIRMKREEGQEVESNKRACETGERKQEGNGKRLRKMRKPGMKATSDKKDEEKRDCEL